VPRTAGHLQELGDAWQEACDYPAAIGALEAARRIDPAPALLERLAGLYLQRQAWSKAATAAREGLARARGARRGRLQLLLGSALYQAGRAAEARLAFQAAGRLPATARQARAWLQALAPGGSS